MFFADFIYLWLVKAWLLLRMPVRDRGMLKAYIFVATVLILVFAGLSFASSALFRSEVNFQERIALLGSLQSDAEHLQNLAESASAFADVSMLSVPIRNASDRLADLSDQIAEISPEGLFGVVDQDFVEIQNTIDGQIATIIRTVDRLLTAKSQTEVVIFAAALENQFQYGAILDAKKALRERKGELQFVEGLVVNLSWLLIPIQALIYYIVWKFLIVKVFRKQKEIYKELKASKEKADQLAQQAIAADEAKSKFLHHFSHELRTPLNGLMGLTDVLRTNENPEQKVTNDIINSAKDLDILISGMIEFSDVSNLQDVGGFEGFLKITKDKQRKARAEHKTKPLEAIIPKSDIIQNLKILVADDNKTNRLVMNKLVAGLGGKADIVEDGQEAIAAYKANGYDLLLLDIQMPNKTGVEALEAIRDLEADQNRNPAVALAITANTLEQELRTYKAAGFAKCLAKPITKKRLADAISACL